MTTESRDRWLAQLYEENYRRVYRLAIYRLRQGSGRIEEAEDVVQEVFCRAIQHEVWQHENPAGWLIVATNNVCSEMYKQYVRQGKRQEKLEQKIKDAKPAEVRTLFDGAASSETEISDIMMTFEKSLSSEDAALIKEYCIDDTPIEDISRSTGLSANHIRVKIHRIRKLLLKLMGMALIAAIMIARKNNFS
ncbi:MAG: RNA polymerase sigma factor [Clostridiales bacterium]|nr:RNA polymerase sigma factor [Clostridiales bacterium]